MSVENEGGESIADLAGLLVNDKPAKGDGGKPAADDHVDDDTDDGDVDGGDDWKSPDDDGDQSDDDATKPDDEADEGEGDEEGEGEGGNQPEPLYTVTIDGKPQQVTLKEALAGYSRTQDYTLKTQQIAEARKAIEQEAATHRAAREQYEGVLKTLQERLGSEADEPTQAQWDQLKAENPEAYAAAYADYQRRRDARAAVAAEQERVAREKGEEQIKVLREYISKENDALLQKLPAWKDPEKRKAGSKAIFEFAKQSYGFSDEELNKAYDHRIIVMAEDARKYHALKAKMENGKKKLETAPTVAPRARVSQPSVNQRQRIEAEKRFNKTGRVEDAIPLLLGR
jgi:hypothetical protein